jgi:predicted DNA-binding protein (UPF0251 family)
MADFYPTINTTIPQTSPTTPKHTSIESRQQQVITLILQRMSPGEIAKKLGVDRKTVYNDFTEWAKTEQATHLQIEWLNQYEMMKVANPEEAFAALTKVMMKLVEKQAKLEVNLTQNNMIKTEFNLNTDGLSEADKNAVISAGRILIKKGSSQTQPSSLH